MKRNVTQISSDIIQAHSKKQMTPRGFGVVSYARNVTCTVELTEGPKFKLVAMLGC